MEFLCEVFAVTRINQFPRQIAQCTWRSGRALGQSEDIRVFVLRPLNAARDQSGLSFPHKVSKVSRGQIAD